jgi:hypothetical protein
VRKSSFHVSPTAPQNKTTSGSPAAATTQPDSSQTLAPRLQAGILGFLGVPWGSLGFSSISPHNRKHPPKKPLQKFMLKFPPAGPLLKWQKHRFPNSRLVVAVDCFQCFRLLLIVLIVGFCRSLGHSLDATFGV